MTGPRQLPGPLNFSAAPRHKHWPTSGDDVASFLLGWTLVASSQSAHSLQSNMPTEHDLRPIVERYFSRIQRAALMLSGNPWDADDLAQETFLVLTRGPQRFAGRSKLYTWLYGILLNLERRERRRRTARERTRRNLAGQSRECGAERSADSLCEAAEWRRSLWAQVARLPDPQRQALVLRYSEQLSYEEISRVLDCPLGTVKSRIFNGLAALRAMLDPADAAADAPQI